MDIPIIYEDNHLLVVDKPANIPCQKDISGDDDLQSLLKHYLKEKYNKPGNVFLALVQRLDRPVSGVMVLAKTSKAASRLSEQIRANKLFKRYQAVVTGKCPPKGEWVDYLVKNPDTNISRVVAPSSKQGKKAVLRYRRFGYKNGFSLVDIELITGRPHQIRVQFASAGFPLWGDVKYGKAASRSRTLPALRSVEIQFEHPTRGETMAFEVEQPCDEPWSYFGPEMGARGAGR